MSPAHVPSFSMQILGNILLALASLIYLLPVQLLLAASRRARNDGSALWGGLLAFAPLWLVLTAALSVVTARGGLDWLPIRRGGLHLLVLVAGVSFLLTTLFAFFGRVEPIAQLPVVSRPFLCWADLVLPPVVIAFGLLSLNAALGERIPAPAYRMPFAVLGAAALLHGVALLGEWAVRAQRSAEARAQREAAQYEQYDRETLARVQSLDPEKDFAELLEATAWEHPEIRATALAKVRAHPRFQEAVIALLRTWRAAAPLAYLDAHGAAPADTAALAGPVLDAFGELTRAADDEIYRSTNFFPDQFDRRTRLLLSAADRFADQGVDYTGAVRAFRAVLDTGDVAKIPFNARATLDHWLARHATPKATP